MEIVPDLLVAAAPVVDIDGTLLVQGALFLVMVVVLRPLLFNPWLATQQRRAQAIDGALDLASRLRRESDQVGRELAERMTTARQDAATLRSDLRRQIESEQARVLSATRTTANNELEEDRARLRREAVLARQVLRERVDEMAEQIASRILGRTP